MLKFGPLSVLPFYLLALTHPGPAKEPGSFRELDPHLPPFNLLVGGYLHCVLLLSCACIPIASPTGSCEMGSTRI